MLRLVRQITGASMALLFVISTAMAADRSVTLQPDTDNPGFDYQINRSTTLDACQAACTEDRICRAFTFNESSKWCFLKGGLGQSTAFDGATSGTIVSVPSSSEIFEARKGELPFPPDGLIYSAQSFAQDLSSTDTPPEGLSYEDLVKAGDESAGQSNAAAAVVSYRQALAINGNDPALWLKLANVLLLQVGAIDSAGYDYNRYDLGSTVTYAALNGFLLSEEIPERADLLGALAQGLGAREMWREAIQTYRVSLGLIDDADLQAKLDKAVAEHGFRITGNAVDSEAADPRICVTFSDPLPRDGTDLASYIVVEGAPNVAVETEESQICLSGVTHGARYSIKVRAGLPSADGETIRSDATINAYVPDRSPFVGFANTAYVLPAGLGGGLPITSVNAATADVMIYRIGDRAIAAAVRDGIVRGSLSGYSEEDVANRYGQKEWEGQVDLAQGKANELTTTAIPVSEALPELEPGAYVVTARVAGANEDYYSDAATQWFIVTDLGVSTVEGDDGVHVFARSLTSAQPIANAHVKLVAVNNEILGEATTDANGRADFAPGLSRGDGGRAPQLVTVDTADGDYAYLDITRTAFDLTDRGVEGRPSPGPLDLFATTERGVYRPGEAVYLTALLRDAQANAVPNLPLTLDIERPDGVVATHEVLEDAGAGSYYLASTLTADAQRGSWTIKLYSDPEAAPLASLTFLVEDFEPERLAFEVSAAQGPIATDAATEVNVAAKYLYGATAPGLSIEADSVVRPSSSLPDYPGYVFGRTDDSFQTEFQPLGTVGTTDEAGNAVAEVTVPTPQQSTRPLTAQINLRLVDSNGRTVQRSLSRPVLAEVNRIGIKPKFGEGEDLAEGSEAGFDIVTVAPDGQLVAESGLAWTLSRIETNYQWYRDNGSWKWEGITTTREIANGALDTLASGPASIGANIDWGRYRLEVTSSGEAPTSSSYEFYAGYFYVDAGTDTPDKLQVALDKPAYTSGETAHLKLDPQFAGTALVMVVDNRVIDMRAVEVPEGGTTIDLAVTDDWGPGAYVTATLYRPADAAEKRMPARALGLAYADVDPGDRKLDVSIEAATESRPRQTMSVTVKLANVTAGDTAHVAVAAVDLGILNLTNFKTPDPDGWFYGQRQLGVAFRDLYGQLIDPTQGLPGAVRSGGDESPAARLGTPPPTSVLVAQHSGIVTVNADGTATVTFDMPDFSGTVRLMAMAWTDKAVGHAQFDAIVRDPVVVTMSPPRFLRLDDSSRLLVEINNVSGPAGIYKVELMTSEGLSTDATETSFDLAQGDRRSLSLGLTGTAIGDNDLRLIVRQPDGVAYIKELTLGVRAASGTTTTTSLITLAPGESATLDKSYFDGLVAHSASLTFSVGPIARLNIPELLLWLDRYPYGCSEQLTSRAMPLLYLNDVAAAIGMGDDIAISQRVKDAIADLLTHQSSNGSFGLWGPFESSDLWLDGYVTDFLIRAKAANYDVPEQALSMALDNLGNQMSYASDFERGGEDIAYALYDLARAGRAAIGDLRYYLEARLGNFGSPLAQAQLGAALALYGDRSRSAEAFAAAVEGLNAADDPQRWRTDYGTQVRDIAGVLALAAEFKPAGVDLAALTEKLAGLRDTKSYTSTQEDGWTLLAAAALTSSAGDGSVTVDGETLTGTAYQRYDQEHFDDASVTVTNTANTPTELNVSVTGIPATPPPASSDGFTLTRSYYLPDGSEADLSNVRQNDRFVVVLNVTPTILGSGQYLVVDPLPAGFEIENPDLSTAQGVADLGWLGVNQPSHVESRTDRYVAAFRYYSAVTSFSTAYMVRAVSPGSFVQPGATVEDMYRPELRANTEAGAIVIGTTGEVAAEASADAAEDETVETPSRDRANAPDAAR